MLPLNSRHNTPVIRTVSAGRSDSHPRTSSSKKLLGSGSNCLLLSSSVLFNILLALGGLAVRSLPAVAQDASDIAPNITFESNTGDVQINNNVFRVESGSFENSSGIPLPVELIRDPIEGSAQPIRPGSNVPNSVELTTDVDYLNQSLSDILTQRRLESEDNALESATYEVDPDSIGITTQFNLRRSEGNHYFGEGIEATVYAPDGSIISQERAFVRGDEVTIGPDGNPLSEAEQVTVRYRTGDRVELRVLNIPEDNAEPAESGIYFTADGDFAVEDLPNGGDLDFNDGEYVRISGGEGEAAVLAELEAVTRETVDNDVPLDPEMREEEIVETDMARNLRSVEQSTQEDTDWGGIDTPDTIPTQLGHAIRARSSEGDQLVYSRYAATSEVRLGSDGLGLSGQLKPLVRNPNVAPTLLNGNLTFDPTVDNNEAGFTTTVAIRQFFSPTHRVARNMFGTPIAAPDDTTMLMEPSGAFNNRRWVGYVPAVPASFARGEQILSTNGIFEVPASMAVEISPASASAVGRGNAAYLRNVGGLIVEDSFGSLEFIPQWTEAGYADSPIVLEAGTAQRIIYALVPQQSGQNLTLGNRYAIAQDADGYRIADGGFRVISADQQPQNFVEETTEVYAVEDTLPAGNMVTELFNGIPGLYIEPSGGGPIPTVDVTLANEVDARVGNGLYQQIDIPEEPGQMGYAKVTRSAGFYLGGSLTGGIGNQEDTVVRTETTTERETDRMTVQRTVNTFVTPLFERESVLFEVTETTQNNGFATFDINEQGQLSNVVFAEEGTGDTMMTTEEVGRSRDLVRGEEFLVDSETFETVTDMNVRIVESDQETSTDTDTYPNFSSVQGELSLGGVLNWGNTPWTTAANIVKAELFARDTVIGRGGSGSETGWRAEAVFHPFGEVQRAAHYYDAFGNMVPLYKTEPVMSGGQNLLDMLTDDAGNTVEVVVNRFVTDDEGDRVPQMVGTGKAKGPGVYLRVEDVLDDDDSALIAGGVQFAF